MATKKYIIQILLISILFLCSCQNQGDKMQDIQERNLELTKEIESLKSNLQSVKGQLEGEMVPIVNSEIKNLYSQFVGQDYQIKIALPKGYDANSKEKYPVLYVIDAETNFGGVSYIVKRLIKDGLIPPIIVVGIAYNTEYDRFYELRSRDLTPYPDNDLRMGGKLVKDTGGGVAFSEFIEKELFPFISSNYSIDNNDKALYGHSFGGLFGAYVILNKPGLFSKYILLGSSLWYMESVLLDKAKEEVPTIEQSSRIYMGSGDLDLRIDSLQVEFANTLIGREIPTLSLKSEVLENETHRSIFGPGFTNGLRFVYENWRSK